MQEKAAIMTEKNTKFINEKLTKDSPAILVKGLETFVALLRNTSTANMVDVEIYFAEYAKLAKKMQSITAVKHDTETVTMHETALKAQKSAFDAEYPQLSFVCEFGLAFCEYAKKYCLKAQSSGGLDDLEKKLASAQEDVANYNKMEEAAGGKGNDDTKTFI